MAVTVPALAQMRSVVEVILTKYSVVVTGLTQNSTDLTDVGPVPISI